MLVLEVMVFLCLVGARVARKVLLLSFWSLIMVNEDFLGGLTLTWPSRCSWPKGRKQMMQLLWCERHSRPVQSP